MLHDKVGQSVCGVKGNVVIVCLFTKHFLSGSPCCNDVAAGTGLPLWPVIAARQTDGRPRQLPKPAKPWTPLLLLLLLFEGR